MKQFDIKHLLTTLSACATLVVCTLSFTACKTEKATVESIAVFVPGVVSGSPVYEMLVSGAENAVADFNAKNHADGKNAVNARLSKPERTSQNGAASLQPSLHLANTR